MEVQYDDLPFGITTIDTRLARPGFTASHLIVEDGQAAFVDVGTSHTTPLLLEVLRQKQILPKNVKYVMVTHVQKGMIML
jgi:flavorubredoxin